MGELNWLALLLLACIVLLFDSLVIARQLGFIRLPGELTELDMARSGSMAYIELARASLERDEPTGVGCAETVLSGAVETITHARSREEIGRELAGTAASLYSSVRTDRARAASERVAALVSEDTRVPNYKGADAYILITPHGADSSVQDRRGALSRATVQAISKDPIIARSPETIELIVSAAGVSFEAGDPVVQAGALAREIDSLRASIAQARQDAGLAELGDQPHILRRPRNLDHNLVWAQLVGFPRLVEPPGQRVGGHLVEHRAINQVNDLGQQFQARASRPCDMCRVGGHALDEAELQGALDLVNLRRVQKNTHDIGNPHRVLLRT